MLTLQEIRQLQVRDWNEELQKAVRELMKAQFSLRSGHSKEIHLVRNLKRYIAQLKTVAKEQMASGTKKANVVSDEKNAAVLETKTETVTDSKIAKPAKAVLKKKTAATSGSTRKTTAKTAKATK